MLKYLPNMTAAHISLIHGAQGPNSTIVTACAASTQAVGEAFRLIAREDADIVLAGGADSRLDPLLILAYSALGALSPAQRRPAEVSRPFDGQRDGFVLGEGAGVLVLEELEHARRRGAVIYAEVLGLGSSFDAYAVTKPDPEARGAARAIRWALREAHVDAGDIDYINAHGTSTRLNDLMETVAVKRVFGPAARTLPLSSIKSMVGHLIGASGAVEAAALALTLHRRRAAADHQPDAPRSQLRSRLRAQLRPRDAGADGPVHQLRLRRPERRPGHAPLCRLTRLAANCRSGALPRLALAARFAAIILAPAAAPRHCR